MYFETIIAVGKEKKLHSGNFPSFMCTHCISPLQNEEMSFEISVNNIIFFSDLATF